jgi:hypothetical protein
MPERRLQLPPGVAETHQGIAYDDDTKMLHIVSGQLGGGCRPAVTTATRINIDSGVYEMLPSLPSPRYGLGAAILTDPDHPSILHLHVFGGAAENCNQTATNHWRLILDHGRDAKVKLVDTTWQELEAVPDSGTHGRAVVHKGAIYCTAFSDLDQGVAESENMLECQKIAFQRGHGQMVHHPSDAGFLFRYVTDFAPKAEYRQTGGTRVAAIGFDCPICHFRRVIVETRFTRINLFSLVGAW